MVCLFHGDYGPADPGFVISGPVVRGHGWLVDPNLLKGARNPGEAAAIQRHALRGEPVSWCHQGYSWVDQPAIGWFYIAAFVFVLLPYLAIRIRGLSRRPSEVAALRRSAEEFSQLQS